MNIECDIIYSESTDIEKYKAVILPAMYVADEKLLKRLKDYTMHGGTLIATFKTAFANENVKVYLDESLKRFQTVFPAAGSSNSAIELTIPELEKYSNFLQWVDVCKDWQESAN